MGRVPLVFVVLFLVGAKLCFASTLAWSSRRSLEDNNSRLVHDEYPTVRLTTVGISAEGYKALIAEVRESLRSSKDRYGIPLLHSKDNALANKQNLLVNISNHAGEAIALEIDAANADVVGYHVGDYSRYFPSASSYADLERIARRQRHEVELGTRALDESISALNWYADHSSHLLDHSLAHAFLVVTQMVSEAARFRYIENEVSSRIRDNVDSAPDPSVIELENSWGRLSSEIQGSNQGMFHDPVPLRRRDDSWFGVFNVQSVDASISLMSVSCKSSSLHSPLIRLVTSEFDLDCPVDVETTLQIVGSGGLCVAPKDGRCNNGNPIVLSSCKSSQSEDQLWTFKKDGTIQSKGRCMAAYGDKPGKDNYIMIYTCDPSSNVFRWRVWPNGTITSAAGSGFVLSTRSSAGVGTELTLSDNIYSTGQSWLPTNNTVPSVAPLVGLFGFCLQASGDHVLLQKCVDAKEDQAWAFYPDGSIRPVQRRGSCLAAVDLLVKIVDCDPSSSLQRWLFANDGTIVNPGSQRVMDVAGYVGSGLHAFLNFPEGTGSQQWQALLP